MQTKEKYLVLITITLPVIFGVVLFYDFPVQLINNTENPDNSISSVKES